jgi:putative transposase
MATEMAQEFKVNQTCEALGVSKATYYRRKKPKEPPKPRPKQKRALSEAERQQVLDICHSDEFVDKSPGEIQATLLDRGIYLCSTRTFYRILAEVDEVKERRDQARHPAYTKPELCALAPNQVWSWDITDLKGPVKGRRFKLYVCMDIYSRMVVGWMVAEKEEAKLAESFLRTCLENEKVQRDQVTIHADRGAAMTSKPVHQLLLDLGVGQSHSRPHVSDDNPYSEAQFKTLKYCPEFPERFGSIEDARSFCRRYFVWYNTCHRHSGIGMLTPADVHTGRAEEIFEARQKTLDKAFQAHPERFPKGRPHPPALPGPAWINPPKDEKEKENAA